MLLLALKRKKKNIVCCCCSSSSCKLIPQNSSNYFISINLQRLSSQRLDMCRQKLLWWQTIRIQSRRRCISDHRPIRMSSKRPRPAWTKPQATKSMAAKRGTIRTGCPRTDTNYGLNSPLASTFFFFSLARHSESHCHWWPETLTTKEAPVWGRYLGASQCCSRSFADKRREKRNEFATSRVQQDSPWEKLDISVWLAKPFEYHQRWKKGKQIFHRN